MVVGFVLNFVIGTIAYFLLNHMTSMRRIDKATVAGYYGSDSAGTFATCVGVLTGLGMAFNAYMPVMLAVMEIPGCLVALYLVGRLRRKGMDAAGLMPDEPGYMPPVTVGIGPGAAARPASGDSFDTELERGVEQQLEISLEKRSIRTASPAKPSPGGRHEATVFSPANFCVKSSSTLGLVLLLGGIVIGFISGLQGAKVVHDNDTFFVSAFQGALCLFLLGDGHDGLPQVEGPQVGGPRLHRLCSAGPEYLCSDWDQRRPRLRPPQSH